MWGTKEAEKDKSHLQNALNLIKGKYIVKEVNMKLVQHISSLKKYKVISVLPPPSTSCYTKIKACHLYFQKMIHCSTNLKLFTKIAIPPSGSYPHLLILFHKVFTD